MLERPFFSKRSTLFSHGSFFPDMLHVGLIDLQSGSSSLNVRCCTRRQSRKTSVFLTARPTRRTPLCDGSRERRRSRRTKGTGLYTEQRYMILICFIGLQWLEMKEEEGCLEVPMIYFGCGTLLSNQDQVPCRGPEEEAGPQGGQDGRRWTVFLSNKR